MKALLFLLVCSLLIGKILTGTASPLWNINPNIDAGEVVSVNFTAGDTLVATSRTKQQHFNKSTFAIAPRIILGMIGYGHLPPGSASTPIGFKTVIVSKNTTHFNYTTTAYSVVVYLLNYLYLAIQYQDSAFFMETQFLTFNASTNSNVFNEFAAVRYDTIPIANPAGMINNNFTGQDIQFMVYPTGFNLLPKSGRSYFSINASILNQTHYAVNISTIGNNILYEISFSILAFNRGVIMANYTVFIDVVISTLTGNSTAYVTTPFTAQQYMFRNCLSGGTHAEYPAPSSFAYYYTMSSPANDYIIWRTFNNRVRSCPSNATYYQPTSGVCYDICPTLYYANATSLICLPCHYSCQQCSGPYSATLCSLCLATNQRILNGTQCLCSLGFYDNGVALCLACNTECLTCSNGTNSSCLSCSSALFRQLDASLSTCNCQSAYYENTTCLACSSQVSACLTCQYDKLLNNLTCLTCDSSLLRVLSNDSQSCPCQPQYYEDPANFSCIACQVGCLLCSVGPICSSCDATLNRTMGSANASCDCFTAYYQNGSGLCVACPYGCQSCTLGAMGPVCSSCDVLMNRVMGPGNSTCLCNGGFYEDSSNNCVSCPVGCLSCSLSGGSVLCSSCDSALNRVMGTSNLSCVCSSAFYEAANATCQPCQLGCLSCALSGSSVLCSNCSSALNRAINASNLSCDCLSGFYDNSSACIQCAASCGSCTNATYCSTCAATSILTINNTCVSCSSSCLNCSSAAPSFTQTCTACKPTYNLVNGTCVAGTSICGDGILSSPEQCDDNNLVDADGCSSVCKVETNHVCINNATILNYSLCYYSYPIGLNPQLVYKIPGQNSVKLELSVDAPLCNPKLLQNYLELTSYVLLLDRIRLLQAAWIAIPTKQVSYSSSSLVLTILFDYSQDIDLSLKDIQITPSSATSNSYLKYFYASPSAKASLSSPYNNLPTKFYSASSLQAASAFSKVFLALVGLYWIAVIIAFIAKKGAVGTECMLVLQLTYLTLLDIPQLGQCWSGLQLSGKYTFGYNFSLLNNSEADDLKALELDTNLPNTLNITLFILLILCLSVIGQRIYEWWLEKKKRKEIMEMNESSQNRTTKIQKPEEQKFQKVFVVVIDIMLTLLFLTTPIFIIGMSFTSSSSLIGNLVEAAILIFLLLSSWILFYRRSETYAWRTVSFRSIIVNPAKKTVTFGLKILLKHYYFIQFILLCIVSLMIAFMKTSGIVVFIILLLGNIGGSVLHFKVQIYIDRLHSLRAVSNSIALALIMLLHIVQFYAANSLDTSLSLVVVTFLLMLAVLTINMVVLLILWRRQNEKEKDQAHLDMEMKQMANELTLGLANMSMLQGQDINHTSIKHNNSRDFTKQKPIEQDYDSTRSQLLNSSKNKKLFGLIEEKIRELKEFKKNIQAQVDGSHFVSQNTSEGNNNLEGILDQLERSNILGDISNI